LYISLGFLAIYGLIFITPLVVNKKKRGWLYEKSKINCSRI
jgi:hypothetical protein